jgi:TPR repeat protein
MNKYFLQANAAWDAGNFKKAFRLFSDGAGSGDVTCQSSLGYFYDNGIGVEKDIDKAAYWYVVAHLIGNDPLAAHNLAVLYRDAGDKVRASKYFRRAVALGNPDSLADLAELAIEDGDTSRARIILTQLVNHDASAIFPSVRRSASSRLRKLNE